MRRKQLSSRRQACCPATKCSNSGENPCSAPAFPADASAPPANTAPESGERSEMWMWQELPSRSSYLAMKVSAIPAWSAISLAPVL